jgi:hypothetical protein
MMGTITQYQIYIVAAEKSNTSCSSSFVFISVVSNSFHCRSSLFGVGDTGTTAAVGGGDVVPLDGGGDGDGDDALPLLGGMDDDDNFNHARPSTPADGALSVMICNHSHSDTHTIKTGKA